MINVVLTIGFDFAFSTGRLVWVNYLLEVTLAIIDLSTENAFVKVRGEGVTTCRLFCIDICTRNSTSMLYNRLSLSDAESFTRVDVL